MVEENASGMALLANRTAVAEGKIAAIVEEIGATGKRVTALDDEMLLVEGRLDSVEEGLSNVSGLDPRFDALSLRVDSQEEDMKEAGTDIDALYEKIVLAQEAIGMNKSEIEDFGDTLDNSIKEIEDKYTELSNQMVTSN